MFLMCFQEKVETSHGKIDAFLSSSFELFKTIPSSIEELRPAMESLKGIKCNLVEMMDLSRDTNKYLKLLKSYASTSNLGDQTKLRKNLDSLENSMVGAQLHSGKLVHTL